jgi:hypothetical protein
MSFEHRTIKWADSSSIVDSCTSMFMSAHETQLTDGKYSSIFNISPPCSSKSMLWIHSHHPKEHTNKFLALCKLYFTGILSENNHTTRWDAAFLFLSRKNLYFLKIINPFIIRFVNVNISSLNIQNHTFKNVFSVKVIGYLSLSVIKILITSSAVHLFLMMTSTAIHRQKE